MRGFKFISILAVLLWFLSIVATLWLKDDKVLYKDSLFQQQLVEMDVITDEKRILIYGSSGLLLGISAQSLQSITGRSSRNFSTTGFGGQFESAIALMGLHIKKGDILVIGDRQFRNPQPKSLQWYESLRSIKHLIPLIPELSSYLRPVAISPRTSYGDLLHYPPAYFGLTKYNPNPSYDISNIETMRMQIKLVRQTGGCPVLVLVPLLVKQSERSSFETATTQLLSLADSAGLSAHVLKVSSIETDDSLFVDQEHLSAKGRARWTAAIGREMLERNVCNVTR